MTDKIIELAKNTVILVLSIIFGFFAIFPANMERLDEDIAEQIERIAQLEADYADGKIAPIDEASFFDGDLKQELANGLKFNELRFIATHNSYQTPATDEYKQLYYNVSELTLGLVKPEKVDFWSQTLTQQLNCGVRSLEIDIETFDRDGDISFTCMHSPCIDMTTSCYDFALAMKEISMWSDNNPNHLPITIIIEPKSGFLPLKDMEEFNLDYAIALDKTLRETLGEKLFTPADMLRDYESFGAMRTADDWCKAQDMLGKVLILLHECDVTEDYISRDSSIKTQAMFPMLREDDIDRDCTSFILANNPADFLKINGKVLNEKKIIARTRADKFTDVTAEQREDALASNAQIVSTDFPPRDDLAPGAYTVTFENEKTISVIE